MTVCSTEVMMENSESQLPPPNPPTSSTPTSHSDQRHLFIAGRFRDALFSALAAKYAANDNNHEQVKSEIESRLHEYLPSFHTPTHLPYASMIQRAIAELGEEDGLSEESISDFIVKENEDLPWAHAAFLRRHLGKLCESGELVKSKCGRYNFKVEVKGVKRRKRRRKSVGSGRRRGVESRDGIEDFDGKRRSQNPMIVRLRAKEVVTNKGTEERNGSLREGMVGAEDGDHAQGGLVEVLDKLEEVQEDEMIDGHHEEEIKNKDGPEDFDWKKKSRNVVIIGLPAAVTIEGIEERSGSLREEVCGAEEGDIAQGGQTEVLDKLKEVREVEMIDEHHEEKGQGEVMEEPTERASEGSDGKEGPSEEATLEFFDAISNHGNAEESELIDAQCCKKLQEENEFLEFFDAKSDHGDDEANEMDDARSSKGKVLSEVSEHQTETSKHVEQGTTCTLKEAGKNEKTEVLLPSDSPKSHPREHRGRGRPRKLNVHETMAALSSSSARDCNQQHLKLNVEDRGASRSVTRNGTHHVDQRQLQKLPRGRGRGRGRPRVAKQDQISMSETLSPSKHLHQQSPEKKCRGRPPKRKFDADILSKENLTCSENEQQERKRRGCGRGRPPKARKKERESFDYHNTSNYIN